MTDLRIGAIGCGYWGPNLIRNFVEIPGANVIVVSDLQVEPMNRMRQRFPQIEHAVRDYREMFDMDLDAVVIATPPATTTPSPAIAWSMACTSWSRSPSP